MDCVSVLCEMCVLVCVFHILVVFHFDFRFIEIVNIGNPIMRNTLNYGKQAKEWTNQLTNQQISSMLQFFVYIMY